jgi:urease gamma subunit
MREDLEILQGAVDMHIHSFPSLFPRLVDHVEAAEGAKTMGLRAIVLKEHHGYTSDRMYFVRKLVSGIEVYGGVVLNNSVGGINPFAAEAAIELGAKIVWFPTLSAKNHLDQMGGAAFGKSMQRKAKKRMVEKPISVLDEKGKLIPEAYEVIDLVAANDIMLATGHLSIPEVRPLIKAAKERGVKLLYLNHPEYIINGTVEEQKELAREGVYIEHLAIFMFPMWSTQWGIDGVVQMIKEVGPERTVLASDLGQVHNPPPWEGLRMYVRVLLEKGIPEKHLRMMVRDNPYYLLNLA